MFICFFLQILLLNKQTNIEINDGKWLKKDRTVLFFFYQKINRFIKWIPDDWNNGYDNAVVCCAIENQKNADYKLSVFKDLKVKHKCIAAQPLL